MVPSVLRPTDTDAVLMKSGTDAIMLPLENAEISFFRRSKAGSDSPRKPSSSSSFLYLLMGFFFFFFHM